jgi:BA14K-like protein
MENNMRSKLMTGAAALALSACTILATAAPASAQRWHGGWRGGGWGFGGAIAAGVIGGAVAAATSPLWAPGYYDSYYGGGYPYAYGGYPYEPYGYTYAQPPVVAVAPGPAVAQNGDVSYCQSRYRSYNPSTGMYRGFDGQDHPCP